MNKKRRADLEKATALIYEAYSLIENARDEGQKYYHSMPETAFQNVEG